MARRRLRGRVVAVTGSARGIGLATVQALLAEGARVAVGDIDLDALAEAEGMLGPRAFVHQVDVTDRSSFATWLDAAADALGPIDVLVNNAGMMPIGPFVDEPDDIADKQIALNVSAVVLGTKLALERMLVRGRGQVVNVASLTGIVPTPGLVTYTGTKHAVVGLSQAAHYEYVRRGINVSCVLPSFVRTGLISGTNPGFAVPVIDPEDVADAIVGVIRRPRTIVYAPPTTAWAPMLSPFLTQRTTSVLYRLFRLDRVFLDYDKDARRAYHERISQ